MSWMEAIRRKYGMSTEIGSESSVRARSTRSNPKPQRTASASGRLKDLIEVVGDAVVEIGTTITAAESLEAGLVKESKGGREVGEIVNKTYFDGRREKAVPDIMRD